MDRLLIITHNQYGYQINTYKIAHYLQSSYQISYICMDYGRERVQEEAVDVFYVKRPRFVLLRAVMFLYNFLKQVADIKPSIIIVKYFPLCSLICLRGNSKRILAVQTGSVTTNHIKNMIMNRLLKLESRAFNARIVLSDNMLKLLDLPRYNTYVVPLGGEPIERKHDLDYNSVKLVYVGSLNNRRIDLTIKGLKLFIDKNPQVRVSYIIIGFGSNETVTCLKDIVRRLGLQMIVRFEGLVKNSEIGPYLIESNVGVSFIPLTPYYDVQPPSKTIEYLLAGLPVLATGTKENSKLINDSNGIIIDDNEVSFSLGLETLISRNYDPNVIRSNMLPYSWKCIIEDRLLPILKALKFND